MDTASDYHLIRIDLYLELGSPGYDPESEVLKGPMNVEILTMGRCQINTVVDKVNYLLTYHIVNVNAIPDRVMIGSEILDVAELRIRKNETQVIKLQDEASSILRIAAQSKETEIGPGVSMAHRNEIRELIRTYKPDRAIESPVQLKIILRDERPVSQAPRRLSVQETAEVNKQIEEWLNGGIIQPSYSEFTSPVVVARKMDGSARICIDYRRLNQKIVKDHFLLPLIDEQLDKLANARVFSTLDLKNGFFHVRVEEASRKYTSFVTPSGQYEFLRAPFGLCISPTVFTVSSLMHFGI